MRSLRRLFRSGLVCGALAVLAVAGCTSPGSGQPGAGAVSPSTFTERITGTASPAAGAGSATATATAPPLTEPASSRPTTQADVLRAFVETDATWQRAALWSPGWGGRWYCDVAPLGSAGSGRTVYAKVTCEDFVASAGAALASSGVSVPVTFEVRGSGPVTAVQAAHTPSEASLATYRAGLPAAVRAALDDSDTDACYAVPDDPPLDRAGRAGLDAAAGSLPAATGAVPGPAAASGSGAATASGPEPETCTFAPTRQAPFFTAAFGVTTLLQGRLGDRWSLAYVGGPKSQDGGHFVGGGLELFSVPFAGHTQPTDPARPDGTFTDPRLAGPLTVLAAYGSSVVLRTAAGAVVRFDLASHRFAADPGTFR